MRIIFPDGNYDIPYETVMLENAGNIMKCHFLYMDREPLEIAAYASADDARAVMEALHRCEAYGIRVFQFPAGQKKRGKQIFGLKIECPALRGNSRPDVRLVSQNRMLDIPYRAVAIRKKENRVCAQPLYSDKPEQVIARYPSGEAATNVLELLWTNYSAGMEVFAFPEVRKI